MHHFPGFPANVPHPQRSVMGLECHFPRVANAVCPNLATSTVETDKWVVIGDRVRLLIADIDPQDGSQQIVDALTRVESVGRGRRPSVTGGNIKAAVGTESQAAAIMASTAKGQNLLLACRIDSDFGLGRVSET